MGARQPNPTQTDQHTLGHIDCPACERARSLILTRIAPDLNFSVAASLWLQSRSFKGIPGAVSARYIRKTTEDSYTQYVQSLNLFFSELRLEQIHLGHLREYQEARVTGAPPFIRYRRPQDAKPHLLPDGTVLPPKGKTSCPASPKKANQELCVLKMIMRRAGCWSSEMEQFYEPFREESEDLPRALSTEEQKRWLDVSRIRPEWWIVHWYSILAFATGMGSNEMDWLRIGDINLTYGLISVQPLGAKNRYRTRTIPLVGADEKWAAQQLLDRARDLGSCEPQHYLFPLRAWSSPKKRDLGCAEYDPMQRWTNSGIKRQWEEVRRAAGLKDFRRYDTRHTALTRRAESGMKFYELMEFAGHLTPRQTRHYARLCEAVMRKSLEASTARMPPMTAGGSPFYIRKGKLA